MLVKSTVGSNKDNLFNLNKGKAWVEQGMATIKEKWKVGLNAVIDAVGKEPIIISSLLSVELGRSIGVYIEIDLPVISLHKNGAPQNFNLLIHKWPTHFRESDMREPLREWIRQGKLSHLEILSIKFPITQIIESFTLSLTGKSLRTLLRCKLSRLPGLKYLHSIY